MADPIRVLYVDDEPALLDIGKRFLEKNGLFSVDTAVSAPEALLAVSGQPYDAIISDYQMPEMDGIQFLKQIRASGNTIPFIIFTGRGREEVVIQALNAGADFYLQKGGHPEAQYTELSHKIRIAVEGNRSREKIQSLNRLYSVLSATNRAMVYLKTKSEFFSEICRILVETGGFRMAWIGLADREHLVIRPVASAGYIDGYLDTINISMEDSPRGRGPTGTAYREGRYYFSNDIASDPLMEPWRENALRRGYLANAAFPFALETNNAGVISLYAPVAGFFDKQIITLLEELSVDISFALQTIDDQNSQKIAESALRESENRYRSLVDNMHECVVVYRAIDNGEDFLIIEFNHMAEKTEQIQRDKVIGQRVTEAFPGVQEFGILEVFQRVWHTGLPESFPVSFYRDNRISGWRNNFVYRLPSGEIVASYSDETAKKEMELALQESEQRYRNIVEDQTEFISRFLPDGMHVFVNEAYCRYFGLKRDEILGHRFRPKIPAEDKGRVSSFFASLTPGHPVGIIEHRIIMPDGNVRWQRWSDRAIFGEEGKIIEYQSVGRDITELKQEELALQENEERLSSIYNTIGEILFQLAVEPDEQYYFTSVNSAFCRTTGLSFELVVGKNVNEIIPEPSLSMVLEKYRQAVNEKAIICWEETSDYPSGQLTGEVSIAPIFDTAGNCIHLIGSVHDITERKRSENASRESEEKYRLLLQNANDAVYIHEMTPEGPGIFLEVNDKACQMLGYSREELLRMGPYDIDAIEEHNKVPDIAKQLLNHGSAQFQTVHVAKEGYRIPVEISINLFTLHGKKMQISIVRDITERKRVEEILRKSEAQLKRAEEIGKSGSWEFLLNENLVSASDGARTLYGLGETSWTIDEVQKIPLPEYRPLLDTALKDLIAGKSPYNIEFKIRRQSDEAILDIHSVAQYDPGQNVVFGVIHDITDRKQTEEALRQANHKLNLLGSITRHDINNQLTILQGYLEMLKDSQPDAERNEYFQKVVSSAERILVMIQFTKEYEEIGVNAPVWQDIHALVETAAKEVQLKNVVVKNELPMGAVLFADPLIVKVFYNLIENAVEHGGKITTIHFSLEKRNSNHILICEDDGDGIPEKQKEKIFEQGFGKNTGLGLTLSREILDITGITIHETGEPGKGARFEIGVPEGAFRYTKL